jgi:hypothetical protein
MARSDPGFPTQPAFNFTVPLYPQSLDPRSAASLQPFDSASPHPPSLTLSASTSESVESSGLYDTTHFSLRCSNQPQLGHPPAPGQGFTNQALAMPPHMVGAYPDGRKSSQAVDAFLNQSYTAGGELPPYLYGNPPGTDPNLPGLPHPQVLTMAVRKTPGRASSVPASPAQDRTTAVLGSLDRASRRTRVNSRPHSV